MAWGGLLEETGTVHIHHVDQPFTSKAINSQIFPLHFFLFLLPFLNPVFYFSLVSACIT